MSTRHALPPVLAIALLVALSVAVGSRGIPPATAWDAITAYDPTLDDHVIVRDLRLPRTCVALLVGAALGLAGAVMQGLTRNPLADPGILGINAGAAFGVVIGIHVLAVSSLTGYVWLAFVGAAIAGSVVYGVGSLGRDGATPMKLALAGAAVTAFLWSLTSAVLLLDVATLEEYRFWAVGSVAGRGWEVAERVAPFLAVGVLLAVVSARSLDAIALGDDVAAGLGASVRRARATSALAIVLLCGGATAAAGPIAFVGLVVPHVARMLVGPEHGRLLVLSALLGAALLLLADVVGRVVVPPAELQAGVLCALIGAPVFIALVRRRRLMEL